MSKKNKRKFKEKKDFEAMVKCPVCKAFMYPLAFANPVTAEEKNIVYCSSCKRNIAPIIEMDALLASAEALDREMEKARADAEAMTPAQS